MNLSYSDVAKSLHKIQPELAPSELHGVMVGWLCVNLTDSHEWQRLISPDGQMDQLLKALFDETASQLQSDDFSFELLIPEEDTPLAARGQALTEWCQGFLSGFGLTGLNVNSFPEIEEPLKDLAEISKLDYSDLVDDSNDDETAFVEVTEYVRMLIMLIHTEVMSRKFPSTDSNERLH